MLWTFIKFVKDVSSQQGVELSEYTERGRDLLKHMVARMQTILGILRGITGDEAVGNVQLNIFIFLHETPLSCGRASEYKYWILRKINLLLVFH